MNMILPTYAAIQPEYERRRDQEPVGFRLARRKYEEEFTLYTHFNGHEPHIDAINQQRLRNVMEAEQRRLARGSDQGVIASTTNSIRSAVGTMLISIGERIRYEPVVVTEPDRDRTDTVMSA